MKYIFETGGEDSSTFFNNYIDTMIESLNNNQQQDEQQVQDTEEPVPEEESDFIKNLRGYDEDLTKEDIISTKMDELKSFLDEKLNYFNNKINSLDIYNDDDGVDYLTEMYDVRNNNVQYSFNNSYSGHNMSLNQLKQKQEYVESHGNNNAISPAGAQGAFQFMPATWEQYKPFEGASPFNHEHASAAYDKYMNTLLQKFSGNKRKAAASYNAGEGRVDKLVKQYGNNWELHLPSETRNYLKQIFGS